MCVLGWGYKSGLGLKAGCACQAGCVRLGVSDWACHLYTAVFGEGEEVSGEES